MTTDLETQCTPIPSTQELLEESSETNLVEELETVIGSLAQDQKVMFALNESGHLWKFKYGTVEVFVQLSGTSDEDTLTVWSFVLQLPAKNEPELMRKLLEMNWLTTYEAHFGIVDERVTVLCSRTVMDLNPSEISRCVTIVAAIADENDERLLAEYGQ